jgi:hypothetical protein
MTQQQAGRSLKAPPLPTYASSEQSIYYQTAKTLLQNGDFEAALQCLEEGLAFTKQALLASSSPSTCYSGTGRTTTPTLAGHAAVQQDVPVADEEDAAAETNVDVHESMAPFHYLYGSTLLYSIEESQDPKQAMTTNNNNTNDDDDDDDDDDPQGEEEENAENDDPEVDDAPDEPEGCPEEEEQQQQQQDDMEIAWENLESARLILTRLLAADNDADSTMSTMTAEWRAKLRDDLAQVQLRAGDLQKWNSAYASAITDYVAALTNLLPTQIRKRAEIHSNLGAVYLNLVAEAAAAAATTTTKSTGDDNEEEEAAAPATTKEDTTVEETATPSSKRLTREEMDLARLQGFHHYYECAVAFASMMAELAGIENWSPPPAVVMSIPSGTRTTSTIRADLQALRVQVQSFFPNNNVPEAAQEWVQVLDELQETVDEAETAETALSEATRIKEQITAAVAAQQQQRDDDDDDEATSNPFGGASTRTVVQAEPTLTTTNAFGASSTIIAAAAAAPTAAQPVMMVVKKKKKKLETDNADPAAQPSSKRPKNE